MPISLILHVFQLHLNKNCLSAVLESRGNTGAYQHLLPSFLPDSPVPTPDTYTKRRNVALRWGRFADISWPMGSAERHGHSFYHIWVNFLVDVLPPKSKRYDIFLSSDTLFCSRSLINMGL